MIYNCPTLYGSSGSPIISRSNNSIFGLHYLSTNNISIINHIKDDYKYENEKEIKKNCGVVKTVGKIYILKEYKILIFKKNKQNLYVMNQNTFKKKKY